MVGLERQNKTFRLMREHSGSQRRDAKSAVTGSERQERQIMLAAIRGSWWESARPLPEQ